MLAQDVVEPGPGHCPAACVQEQVQIARHWAQGNPVPHGAGRVLPERQDAFAPTLADHMQAGHRGIVELVKPEADQFRDPYTNPDLSSPLRPLAQADRCDAPVSVERCRKTVAMASSVAPARNIAVAAK